jgi:hypothetical protein
MFDITLYSTDHSEIPFILDSERETPDGFLNMRVFVQDIIMIQAFKPKVTELLLLSEMERSLEQ